MISQSKNRVELDYRTRDVNPVFKQVAHIRHAILRACHAELGKIDQSGGVGKVMRDFVRLYNSGLLLPGEFKKPSHISRSTLYAWDRAYKNSGVKGLIPQYKGKPPKGFNVVPMGLIRSYKKITIPGPPRSRGKKEFLRELKHQWSGPLLDCPIILVIFFGMAVPKGTSMERRAGMLGGKISHILKPDLDILTTFTLGFLKGILYRNFSQIKLLHVEKHYRWHPQTQIFIRGVAR